MYANDSPEQLESGLEAPFIVDDESGSPAPVWLQHCEDRESGPRKAADISAALLSMSGYNKSQESDVYGRKSHLILAIQGCARRD